VAPVELGDASKAISPGIFTWSDRTIADDQYVIPVASDRPTDVTSIVGCAVVTSAGQSFELPSSPKEAALRCGALAVWV